MKLFSTFRPLVRIAVALEQIAQALCYFAARDARQNGAMFVPKVRGANWSGDESELLHTDTDRAILQRAQAEAVLLSRGYAALEQFDEMDSDGFDEVISGRPE